MNGRDIEPRGTSYPLDRRGCQSMSKETKREKMFEPKDFLEFEPQGTCGLSVIAVLEHRDVASIKKDWESVLGAWEGFANFKDIERLLQAHNIPFIRKRGLKATDFPKINTKYAIVRVQWLKDDGTEYYWREAPLHTHYVLLQKEGEKQWLFCNSKGWFEQTSPFYLFYLEGNEDVCGGYITSYLEIEDLATSVFSIPNLKVMK